MMNSYIQATVADLIQHATFDFNILTAYDILKSEHPDEKLDINDVCNPEEIAIAQYFISNGYSYHIPRGSSAQIHCDCGDFLETVMDNATGTVIFEQSFINPYVFRIISETYCIWIPLLLTRNLLSLFKTLGVKCDTTKKNKCLMGDTVRTMLCELALTGKTDINDPVFNVLKAPCKALKGRINPWFKDGTVHIEDQNDYLNEANLRFRGAEWFAAAQRDVALIGCGGLGSNIAVSLCRVLGKNTLSLYDADNVEHRNLAGQNFGVYDIGLNKASLVKEQCSNFNPVLYVNSYKRYSETSCAYPIVITGLDNMASRKLVFAKWQSQLEENDAYNSNKNRLLLDARLSAEKWQIFCVTGDNKAAQKEYEDKWLFDDSEADSDVCSYKQTAFAAQMCAAFVTNLYINFCTNLSKDADNPLRRYLPFMTEYDATQMILRHKEVI